jgi:hypothetical protein
MESKTAAVIAPKYFEHIKRFTPLPAPEFSFTGNRSTLSQHFGGVVEKTNHRHCLAVARAPRVATQPSRRRAA